MHIALFGMEGLLGNTYVLCTLVAGGLLTLQTLMALLGLGGDELEIEPGDLDVEGPEALDPGFQVLSLRSVLAFFTFFGLTGWFGTLKGWSTWLTGSLAVADGLAAMLLIAWLLYKLYQQESQGNLDPANAVGCTARVYLRVPGKNSGLGKIQVKVQGRTAEFQAFTQGEELPTGSLARVAAMSGPDTFEVVPLKENG